MQASPPRAVLGLTIVAAIGFASVRPASSFDAPYNDGAYHGGPYSVAGFGAGDLTGRRRPYWGGPYFVSCPGNNPPFETHSPPYPRCGSSVKIAIRVRHHRPVRLHLKQGLLRRGREGSG